jgi:hypothetical protein
MRIFTTSLAAAVAGLAISSGGGASGFPLDVRRQHEACRFAQAHAPEISAGSLVEFAPLEPPAVSAPPKGAEKAVEAWRRRGATNLFVACPELMGTLPHGVRPATAHDYTALKALPAPKGLFITGFLAPFVSADGRYMITSQIYRCPGCAAVTSCNSTPDRARDGRSPISSPWRCPKGSRRRAGLQELQIIPSSAWRRKLTSGPGPCLQSRDVTYATVGRGPYEGSLRYRDLMGWETPW